MRNSPNAQIAVLGIDIGKNRGGSGNLDAKDKWIFCLKAA
jgi:hypothetical protein